MRQILCICLISVLLTISASISHAKEHAERVVDALNTYVSGDLEELLKRGFIRVLSVRNPIYFNLNSFDHSGYLPDQALEFEKFLKRKYGKKARNIKVLLIPVSRSNLISYLEQGKGDIAIANLTITPERSKRVSFTNPLLIDTSEILITSASVGEINSFDELGRLPIHVRKKSSYFKHLNDLNILREKENKSQLVIKEANEHLEDYELLEMLHAGILPAIIMDKHKAALWGQFFLNLHINENTILKSGNNIAWAVRKSAPQLLKMTNEFVGKVRKGTLLGNVLIKKHLKSKKWIENIDSEQALKRYDSVVNHIKNYANKYEFNWLMITAQGYQESRLDQSKKSKAGAIGVMQVLPTTARDKNVNIPDIHKTDKNIHAGVKYLRFLKDYYFSSDDMKRADQVFFSFAAYNAGPGNVDKARRRAKKLGLDPNVWFENVEIAMAEAVSREPVIYVRNILKYYVAYTLLTESKKTQ